MVNCLGLLALAWTLTATPSCPRAPAVTLQAPTSAGGGYPEWPEAATTGRRELSTVLQSFTHVVTAVPVEAASEAGCQWEAFLDGGFEAHRFIHRSISRESYPEVLECLHIVLLHCREAYPDLWAVLKFVPKKNGLSPVLALLAREGAGAVSVATLSPRVLRRRLDDLQRALEQSWALLSCYLTQPQGVREELLWAARTVTERRGVGSGQCADGSVPWLRDSFGRAYSADDQQSVAALGKRGWERSRLSYPYLEVAGRAWLASAPSEAASTVTSSTVTSSAVTSSSMASLLFRIAKAAPGDKALNSLLYWLLDLVYKAMGAGLRIPRWAPEPYLLRVPGAEARMVSELRKLGHLLHVLARARAAGGGGGLLEGAELLRAVREVETTATLLATIGRAPDVRGEVVEEEEARSEVAAAAPLPPPPRVVARYAALVASPGLGLVVLRSLQHEALAELLDLEVGFVAARHAAVAKALAEWRRPELLFRWLDDNRADANAAPLIRRWLRAILGLSTESLRQIRREDHANVRHLCMLPRGVLLRWYAEACPGTSSMQVLFSLGEDAGSCLRIVSNEGNRYNRALAGLLLQSHVRALVVRGPNGGVLARSLVRLLLRSDSLTPVIFCEPIFFAKQDSRELRASLHAQARALERHCRVPVVHAGSVLPVLPPSAHANMAAGGGRVRRVAAHGYDVTWVDLVELDGVAAYTYSEELPYDQLLAQHAPGVLERTEQCRVLTVAALPRADSPSAQRYAAERAGQTAWTRDCDGDAPPLPEEALEQLRASERVSHTFNPATARARDLCTNELDRRAERRPIAPFQASLLAWLVQGGQV